MHQALLCAALCLCVVTSGHVAEAKKAPPPDMSGTYWRVRSNWKETYTGAIKQKSLDPIEYWMYLHPAGAVILSNEGFTSLEEPWVYGEWIQNKGKILITLLPNIQTEYLHEQTGVSFALKSMKCSATIKRSGFTWALKYSEKISAYSFTAQGKIKYSSVEKGVAELLN